MSGSTPGHPVPTPRAGLFARVDDAVYAVEHAVAAVTMGAMALVVFLDVVHRRLDATDSKIGALIGGVLRLVGVHVSGSMRAWLDGPITNGLLIVALFGLVRYGIVTIRRHHGKVAKGAGLTILALGITAAIVGALWLMLHVRSRWYVGALVAVAGAVAIARRRGQPGFGRFSAIVVATVVVTEWLVQRHIAMGYTWSKEVSMVLLVWNGMLGASMCSHDGKHIEFDFGPRALPVRLRPFVLAAGPLVQLFFTVFLAAVGWVYCFGSRGLFSLEGTFEMTGIPDWTVGLACPFVFALISLRTADKLIRQLTPLGPGGLPRVLGVVAVVFGIVALSVWAALSLGQQGESVGSWGWLPFLAVLTCLLLLGEPLYVLLGGVVLTCFLLWTDSISRFGDFTVLMERIRGLADQQALLAVPFFTLSGTIMASGKLSTRLIDFAKAAVGWLPGGLAHAAILACVIFAAIIGSSPATLAAVGSVMAPALIAAKYREDFSIGLVTTTGSLGILIPPSIPMIIFTIFFTATPIEVEKLFLAGVGPGVFVAVIIGIYSSLVAVREKVPRQKFDGAALRRTFREGLWALMLPFVILGGIYGGVFNATEASAVAVVYAIVAELYFERGLSWKQLPKVVAETSVLLGSFIIVIVMAMALQEFLETAGIPQATAVWITGAHLSSAQFLAALLVVLLIVGCLVDIMSAIMIFAPLVGHAALELGIDPVHLGIIFIITLEVGYLTPPVGLNLFLSCTMFGKSFGYLFRSTLPFVGVMLLCVVAIAYVPDISLAPVRWAYGEPAPPPAPLVDEGEREGPREPDKPDAGTGAGAGTARIQSIEEMMREAAEREDDGAAEPEPEPRPERAPDTGRIQSIEEMMREAERARPGTDSAP